MTANSAPTKDTARAVTIEDAWRAANEFCHSVMQGGPEFVVFERLMDEIHIFLLDPDEMADLIIRNILLAEHVKAYFNRDSLTETEIKYYLLLVARGDIK